MFICCYSYKWLCYVLHQPGEPCYIKSSTLPGATDSRLQVRGADLRKDFNNFAFNVTVSKPGRISGMASQVLHVQTEPLLE